MRSWAPLQACTGLVPRPAASAGQVVGELLRLVGTELQAFELLALPAGPLAGARCWAPLQACMGGRRGWSSASGGRVAGELLCLVRIALQAFKPPGAAGWAALPAHGAALASVVEWHAAGRCVLLRVAVGLHGTSAAAGMAQKL